ncbi:10681_t:CDS:2, partial [Diversispora eburnea]
MAEIISDTELGNSQKNIKNSEPSVPNISRETSNSNLIEASSSNLTRKIDTIVIIVHDKSYKAAKDSSTSILRSHIIREHKYLNQEVSTSRPLDKFIKSKKTLT